MVILLSVSDAVFDDWVAQRYERLWPELFDPAVVDPAVDLLADLADTGPRWNWGSAQDASHCRCPGEASSSTASTCRPP